MRLFCMAFVMLITFSVDALTIRDAEKGDIHKLFANEKTKYVIQYAHQFTDTLWVPYGCELKFEGGSLKGPIVFNETKLSGNVKLNGSVISGTIKNNEFDASWLCSMDGITDDAPCINEMIEISGNVFFPKGTYKLVSSYDASSAISKEFQESVSAHIGINKSNVTLTGESGTIFVTDEPLGTICVFSLPYEIEKSICNIRIENITFEVHNDAKDFHEFMHTIKIIGVNGITIKNCTFNDFWGDAICLSHYGDDPNTGERTRNQNVKVINNKIVGGGHYNNRNGISVINGKRVLIKNNVIKNTSRWDMPGGVDIEPNNSAFTIENIIIKNNIFEGINGSGGAIGIVALRDGPAHKISIINNKIRKSRNGILLYIDSDDTTDRIRIKKNYIDQNTSPYNFVGTGRTRDWVIKGNTFACPIKQTIPGKLKVFDLTTTNNKYREN